MGVREPIFPREDCAEFAKEKAAPLPSSGRPRRSRTTRFDSHMTGHRERLRRRFIDGGADAIPDYELLELILYRAMPRGDTKPLAHRLIKEFGDLNRVLAAQAARLLGVTGVGERVLFEIRLAAAVGHRMTRTRVLRRPVLSSWDDLRAYCQSVMAHLTIEQFRVLYLDRKNVLISDETQGEGTVDHVPVYPRTVIKRALELDASALILVHNHPSGDPSPSPADIDMTGAIRDAAAVMGITLHDHLIVGQGRDLSFRAEGYL